MKLGLANVEVIWPDRRVTPQFDGLGTMLFGETIANTGDLYCSEPVAVTCAGCSSARIEWRRMLSPEPRPPINATKSRFNAIDA
jgi:hypothetical protein